MRWRAGASSRDADGRGVPVAAALAAWSLLWLVAVAVAAPGAARAQDDELDEEEEEVVEEEDYYARSGAYFEALFTNNIGSYQLPAPLDDTKYSTGVAGGLGYRINTYTAVEVFGDWVSGFNLPGSDDYQTGLIGMNGRLYAKGGRWQPFLMAGLGASYVRGVLGNSTEWDLGVRLGAGLDFYINEELGISFVPMYVLPVGAGGTDLFDAQYVSIGIGAFIRLGGD